MSDWQKYLSGDNEGLNMDIDIELEKIIEKYDLDKLDPAYRQRKKALAIIKKIVDLHNGRIYLKDITCQGYVTEFNIELKKSS